MQDTRRQFLAAATACATALLAGETYGSGHTHSHTFETAGEYSYRCVPHRTQGMTGSFTVTEWATLCGPTPR